MTYPAKTPVRQYAAVATMKRSTLPYYFGNSFSEAAGTAADNQCGVWRVFEVRALKEIAAGNFDFERGDVPAAWHVTTWLNGKKLTFMFVKITKYRKTAYHIIYESWHM